MLSRKKRSKPSPGAHRNTAARAPLTPQLATLVANPPEGSGWVHEIKYDGYRIIAVIDPPASPSARGREAKLISRNGHDWSQRFAPLAKTLGRIKARAAVLDGEVVALTEDARDSFQALQNHMQAGDPVQLCYFAFDIMLLNGEDLRDRALIERKKILLKLLKASRTGNQLRFSEYTTERGSEVFKRACANNLEGIISKRADSPYTPGRSLNWLKSKCVGEDEFLIGGFTAFKNDSRSIGALLPARFPEVVAGDNKNIFFIC